MAPAPWDGLPEHNTLFVLVTGGNRYAPSPQINVSGTGSF